MIRQIGEGSEKEGWYFPGFLCLCVHTHSCTAQPPSRFYLHSSYLPVILPYSSYSFASASPPLPFHSDPFFNPPSLHLAPRCASISPFSFALFPIFPSCFQLPRPFPPSVLPPRRLLFSTHLVPLSEPPIAQTGTGGKETVAPRYQARNSGQKNLKRRPRFFTHSPYRRFVRAVIACQHV